MDPRVVAVQPMPDYKLLLFFTDGAKKLFDVGPYLNRGVFRSLVDVSVFNTVKPFNGSILWQGDIDLCPDTLYKESKDA